MARLWIVLLLLGQAVPSTGAQRGQLCAATLAK
jgi:hypothetical protein